jgi:hypothetical protein
MKEKEVPIHFFAVVFCWVLFFGCASSPESEAEPDVLPFEPGLYLSQDTAEELYLSTPVNMSGTCTMPETDKTGTYSITKSAYTDSHTITFRWSDGSATSAFVSGGNRKTLRFGTAEFWMWVRVNDEG